MTGVLLNISHCQLNAHAMGRSTYVTKVQIVQDAIGVVAFAMADRVVGSDLGALGVTLPLPRDLVLASTGDVAAVVLGIAIRLLTIDLAVLRVAGARSEVEESIMESMMDLHLVLLKSVSTYGCVIWAATKPPGQALARTAVCSIQWRSSQTHHCW